MYQQSQDSLQSSLRGKDYLTRFAAQDHNTPSTITVGEEDLGNSRKQ